MFMTTAADLPRNFHHVRLLLAREPGHPDGEAEEGYDLLVPLDGEHRLDSATWKKNQMLCRVRRFHADGSDRVGRLRRKPGGQWYFDYVQGTADDEVGFVLGSERFVTGEYVALGRAGRLRTFRVSRVERP